MARRRKPPAAVAADFSDKAKRDHGIEPRDLAVEIKALKITADILVEEHTKQMQRMRDRIRDAITALEDGRRGDGLAILRGLTRTTDGRLPLKPETPEPPRAA